MAPTRPYFDEGRVFDAASKPLDSAAELQLVGKMDQLPQAMYMIGAFREPWAILLYQLD